MSIPAGLAITIDRPPYQVAACLTARPSSMAGAKDFAYHKKDL
jgi:hypothetical protein